MQQGGYLACLAFLGLLLGYNAAIYYHMQATDAYFNLEKLKLYATGAQLMDAGFFA